MQPRLIIYSPLVTLALVPVSGSCTGTRASIISGEYIISGGCNVIRASIISGEYIISGGCTGTRPHRISLYSYIGARA